MSECKDGAILFDPADFPAMLKLMDAQGKCGKPLFGKNENGEDVRLSVYSDRIVCVTYQNNGWLRKNVYWRDGTCEEFYGERW